MAGKTRLVPVLAVLLALAPGLRAEPAPAAAAVAAARAAALPIVGADGDYDALLAAVGEARVVMLGEATHGSREFYRERARITRRLILERGFTGLVLEAPREPARRLDAYVRGEGRDADAAAALQGFSHFPRWMWRNETMREILEGLRAINLERPAAARLRIFGMDLYSLPQSADAVVRHRARQSVAAAARARQRYGCFDHYRAIPDFYGRDVAAGRRAACTEGAAAEAMELATQATAADADGDAFAAWQSARTVVAAERYYRSVYGLEPSPWNGREAHLADTLDQILEHLGPTGKIVVWAHNTHQGDARETDQGAVGELSIGQLMRQGHGDAVRLVGFTTHRGEVRAAPGWGRPDRIWTLRPALAESWTGLLHRTGLPAFLLLFRDRPALAESFAAPRLDRAVGVSYLRHAERRNHYYHVRLGRQFDAVVHLDATTAVVPLPD